MTATFNSGAASASSSAYFPPKHQPIAPVRSAFTRESVIKNFRPATSASAWRARVVHGLHELHRRVGRGRDLLLEEVDGERCVAELGEAIRVVLDVIVEPHHS